MGEAKRRRSRIGENVGLVVEPRTGKSCAALYAGRQGEFLASFNRTAGAARSVPCNGCVACCYHPCVDVDPDQERADDLAHLDLVSHPKGGLALRKREDGACVHLGPIGCTVYAHRPRACRSYDCRIYSVIGVADHYDNDQTAPGWVFDVVTETDQLQGLALHLGAMKHIAAHAKWTAEGALAAAFNDFLERLPIAKQMIETIERMSPDEREAMWTRSRQTLAALSNRAS
jgi:hypothetical protein